MVILHVHIKLFSAPVSSTGDASNSLGEVIVVELAVSPYGIFIVVTDRLHCTVQQSSASGTDRTSTRTS